MERSEQRERAVASVWSGPAERDARDAQAESGGERRSRVWKGVRGINPPGEAEILLNVL